jgi:hypothetical protein
LLDQQSFGANVILWAFNRCPFWREYPLRADFVEEVGELAVSERIGIRRA